MLGASYLFNNAQNMARQQQQMQKNALIKKNYDEIYSHELAHKMAGGHLAGAIVIERNSQGIPFAGHVDIKMPTINPQNPKQTMNDADTVIRAAMAPADPSGQDYKVAEQAKNIKDKAQNIQNKRLNFLA